MPFTTGAPQLTQIGPNSFQLERDVTYVDAAGVAHTAPAGATTDLASVPSPLWSIIGPFGDHTRASIVHDVDSRGAREIGTPRSKAQYEARRTADTRYRTMLKEDGVPAYRATMLWAGVALNRIFTHSPPFLAWLMPVQISAGYVAIAWGAFNATTTPGLIALVAPLLLILLFWGPSRWSLAIVQYPVMLLIALGLVNWVFAMLEWLANVISGAKPSEQFGAGKKRFRNVGPPPLFRIVPKMTTTEDPVASAMCKVEAGVEDDEDC